MILFGLCYECIAVSYGMVLLLLWYTHTLLSVRVTHPRVLRTDLFWPCVLRTAILWPRVLRTVKQLKTIFGVFIYISKNMLHATVLSFLKTLALMCLFVVNVRAIKWRRFVNVVG